MTYTGDSNGKGDPQGIVSDVAKETATEFFSSLFGNPLLRATARVAARRIPDQLSGINIFQALAQQRQRATGGTLFTAIKNYIPPAPVIRQVVPPPSINVVSLPNGTAVPAPVTGPTPILQQLPSGAGSGWFPQSTGSGPPSGPPMFPGSVEVGTLDDGSGGDSNTMQAGMGGLSALTQNPVLLGAVALAAFLMLDGKPKRRRR